MRLPSALALLVLLVLPGAASAAPPWSAPQNVSSPHLFVSQPALAFSGDGTALAAWRWQDGIRDAARGGDRGAARAPGATAFGAQRSLPSGRVGGAPFLYASSRAVVAFQRRTELRVAFGNATGAFGASRLVARRSGIRSPVLAGNARGDVGLVWFEDRGTSTDRVYLAFRRAGGVFGRPVLLHTGRIRSTSVAVGPNGDVLVAWDARGVVQTRYKPRSRSFFFRPETIRSQDAFFAGLRTTVAANGRAYVAWGAQFLSEGGDTGPVYLQVAVRPSGSRFRAAELLEESPSHRSANPVALAAGPDGRATVVWTGYDGATNRVRAARTDDSGRFSTREGVSPPGEDAVVNDAAAGSGGQVLAAWTAFLPGERRQVRAAIAPSGASFGPPEDVSAREEADSAVAAFDPRTGHPTVAWVNRPAGSRRPLDTIQTYLQAAARTG